MPSAPRPAVAAGRGSWPSRRGRLAARLATVGYAVPGTVVAVAVYVPLVWVDRRLVDLADSLFDLRIDLLFTGTVLGLVVAYLVRFHALAYLAVESRMARISPDLDDAARALGADRARVLADVHLPLLRPGILAATLLVLVVVVGAPVPVEEVVLIVDVVVALPSETVPSSRT